MSPFQGKYNKKISELSIISRKGRIKVKKGEKMLPYEVIQPSCILILTSRKFLTKISRKILGKSSFYRPPRSQVPRWINLKPAWSWGSIWRLPRFGPLDISGGGVGQFYPCTIFYDAHSCVRTFFSTLPKNIFLTLWLCTNCFQF